MPDESLELQDLLRSLQQEGAVVDQGQFSLDPAQALEKLRRYQLGDSSAYLLKWVQAGVARGATCVRAQVSAGRVSLDLEGICFSPSELEHLFPRLLNSGSDPALRALAIGVNSALAQGPSRIVLQSWDGGRGFEHSWSKQGPRQRPFRASSAQPLSRLWLERRLTQTGRNWWSALKMPIFEALFSRQSSLGPEASLLADSHCLLPAPLYLNGRLCERRFGQPRGPLHHRLELYFPGEDCSLRCPAATLADQARGFEPGAPMACVIAFPEDRQQAQRLWIVESGVILASHTLAGKGAMVVACGRLFDKDLSDFRVIQNERYHNFLQLTQERIGQELF